MADARKMHPRVKMATDFGPLLIFFATFYTLGIMHATGAIIVATLIALGISYTIERKVAPLPLISGILITVFGGVTLLLNDPVYLILKTTIFYGIAAGTLFVGLMLDKPLIKYLFNSAFVLTHDAWRTLTWRWIALFILLAVVNVAVYFTLGLDFWVNFKVWGVMAIIFAFTFAQMPFIAKNQIEHETTD